MNLYEKEVIRMDDLLLMYKVGGFLTHLFGRIDPLRCGDTLWTVM